MAAPLAVLAVVLFATSWYTGQVWEDFLITFRHSRNWAEGHGLVYQPGERVQGFTSPLNVLIPALSYAVCPRYDFVLPLWVFRVVGLGVLLAGMAVLWRRAGPGPWRWMAVFLIITQVKTVAFAMNGQEAAFLLGFLALALAAAQKGVGADWALAGTAWAGLWWTRPDAPVYIAAVAVGGLWFGPEPWRVQRRGILKAAGVMLALYAPWLGWAWSYYGNPIPQTVLAKFGAGHALPQLSSLPATYGRAWLAAAGGVFTPIYEQTAHWPAWSLAIPGAIGVVSAFVWAWRRADPLTRLCSWVCFSSLCYLALLQTVGTAYPWYFPPAGLSGAVVLARSAGAVWARARTSLTRLLALTAGGFVAAALAWLMVFGIEQQRIRQVFIEHGVREQIGRWLGAQMKPDERVFLEPIGYIGYFSQARVLDYPGLVSPQVVAVRRAGARTYLEIIERLKPAWVVFRESEYRLASADAGFAARYEVVHRLRADPRILRYRDFPGYGYIFADGSFVVCRQRAAP